MTRSATRTSTLRTSHRNGASTPHPATTPAVQLRVQLVHDATGQLQPPASKCEHDKLLQKASQQQQWHYAAAPRANDHGARARLLEAERSLPDALVGEGTRVGGNGSLATESPYALREGGGLHDGGANATECAQRRPGPTAHALTWFSPPSPDSNFEFSQQLRWLFRSDGRPPAIAPAVRARGAAKKKHRDEQVKTGDGQSLTGTMPEVELLLAATLRSSARDEPRRRAPTLEQWTLPSHVGESCFAARSSHVPGGREPVAAFSQSHLPQAQLSQPWRAGVPSASVKKHWSVASEVGTTNGPAPQGRRYCRVASMTRTRQSTLLSDARATAAGEAVYEL